MKKRFIGLFLLFAIALSAISFTSCSTAKPEEGSVTRMTVDINPSVEFMIDDENKVISVTALNDDGSILIVGEAFVGKTPEQAIEMMISLASDTGYLVQGNVDASENTVKIFLWRNHSDISVIRENLIILESIGLITCHEEIIMINDLVQKEIEKNSTGNLEEKHLEYFTDLLTNNPEPFYAGIHGPNNPIWQKQLKKHHRSMPIFLVRNNTQTYRHKIDRDLVEKVLSYCQNNQCSPANLFFYASSVALAKLNGNLKNIMPIGLYNCRHSAQEKRCAGPKVQSAACYTKIDYALSFEDNLKAFSIAQNGLYRHIKFKDRDFEALMHNIYRSSPLLIYYSIAYSLIPIDMPEGVEFNLYTNGNCALPAYVIQVLDAKTKEVDMAYDVQTKITSEDDVSKFHTYYLNVLKQVLDDPDIKVADIKL